MRKLAFILLSGFLVLTACSNADRTSPAAPGGANPAPTQTQPSSAPAASTPLDATPAAGSDASTGRRAPSFSLPDSNLLQHDILDYRGKWLLMTFTTTVNCPQCGPLAKALEPLQKQAAVLNVMISPPENANTAGRFATDNKITSPIVFDQSQVAIAYFRATPTNSRIDTPHVFIINPAGNIVQDWPEGTVAQLLDAKGGVAGAFQAMMSGAK